MCGSEVSLYSSELFSLDVFISVVMFTVSLAIFVSAS